ncbi:MAG: DUF4190 domain-containing protein [Planctomycetota bacterium]
MSNQGFPEPGGRPAPARAAADAPPPPLPEQKTSGLAVAALVLGIASVLTCGVASIPGLIVGIIALVKINNSQGRLSGQGMAIAGTVLS